MKKELYFFAIQITTDPEHVDTASILYIFRLLNDPL